MAYTQIRQEMGAISYSLPFLGGENKNIPKEAENHLLSLYFGKNPANDYEKIISLRAGLKKGEDPIKIPDITVTIEKSREVLNSARRILKNWGYNVSKFEWMDITNWTKEELRDILKNEHNLTNGDIESLISNYKPNINQ